MKTHRYRLNPRHFMLSLCSLSILLLGAFLAVGPRSGAAQGHNQELRTCATDQVHERLLKTDPDYRRNLAEIEDFTRDYIQRRAEASEGARAGVVTIPVVVHVVYNTAVQNISDAQVQSQIAVLNEDFRRLNSDAGSVPAEFAGVTADARIQFALAVRDPNCNPTTGITRTATTKTSFRDDLEDIKYNSTGGHDAWPRDKYLNLWIGGRIISPGIGDLLGYAQFPGGPAATDGVVIAFDAFGDTGTAASPFNLGRTTTHEIGHWLGLRHTFQGGCAGNTAGTCLTGGDLVCDTPSDAAPSYGCPGTQNTCTETPTDRNDQTMNYMDYTNDACMFMFSNGQSQRMDATLFGPRASIIASDALTPPLGTAAADLWSQDTGNDNGTEPNATGDAMYVSHDIWVRNANDGLVNQEHQNPQASATNYVYVRIRNRSCATAGDGTVKLYWAKASTGLSWPAPWDASITVPALLGDAIGTQPTGSVAAGGYVILAFPWSPPNPADYASFGADKAHFCLLSRIETDATTPYGMTSPETGNLWANVANNNNIVWKNISVVGPGGGRDAYVTVANFDRDDALTALLFAAQPGRDKQTAPLLRWGTVKIDLGEKLFDKWEAGGKQGGGVEVVGPNTIQVFSPNAWIGNLKFAAGEVHAITVHFAAFPHTLERHAVYDFNVTQFALRGRRYQLVGGEHFVLKTSPRSRG